MQQAREGRGGARCGFEAEGYRIDRAGSTTSPAEGVSPRRNGQIAAKAAG